MTTKRRITIFPVNEPITSLQADGNISGQAVDARASAGRDRPMNAAVITAGGRRFPLSQIGSIFGSE